jgi:hypothetical protein
MKVTSFYETLNTTRKEQCWINLDTNIILLDD